MVRRASAVERRPPQAKRPPARERVENALRENGALLHAVVSDAPVVLFALDREGVFTLSEGKALGALGLKPGEVVGQSVYDVYGDVPQITDNVRRALAGKPSTATVEVAGVTFECRVSPIRAHNGEVSGVIGVATDITEHTRTEEALRESEEKYRRLVENSIDGTAIVEGLELRFVNKALLRMYGADSEEEMVGHPFTDFVSPEYRKLLAERGRAREDGQDAPAHYEYKALRRDGTEFDAEVAVSRITYRGRVARQAVIRDITEHKRAEEALRESEERYRAIFDQAADSVVLIDAQTGALVEFNDRAHESLGYTLQEFETLKIPDFEVIESPEQVAKHIERITREGSATFETKHRTKGGEIRDIRVSARAISIRGRDFIQSIWRDITERKKAKESLRKSEARYRLLAEHASDVIWTTDTNLGYTYVSPSVTRMRGYSPEEVVAGTMKETLTPASLEIATKTLAEELAIERMPQKDLSRSRTLELEMNCKDGSTIWAEVRVTFLRDPDGQAVGLLGVTRDITERKKAKESLRESEARYRRLVENVSDVIWTMDLNLSYTYVSAVSPVRGYSVEEVMAQRMEEAMTPASLEVARKTLAEELAIEQMPEKDLSRSRTLELEFNCKDGSTIWNEVRMTFQRDPDNNPVGILGVSRDITERKQAEQRYRELFEEAPVMYVITANHDGIPIVTDCNDLFLSTLGYGRAEVMERPLADFYTPESRAQLLEAGSYQKALKGEFVTQERQLLTRDGRVVETLLRATPETNSDGNVSGTRAMYLDISDRQRAEEALRESETRYRLLAENQSDVIWTMDLNLTYTYVSPSVMTMRGYSPEEVVGTRLRETMTPASLDAIRKIFAEEMSRPRGEQDDLFRPRTIEVELYCKDGSTVWTEIKMTYTRDSDGRPLGIVGVSRDITERKQAEKALRGREAILEAISFAASRFLRPSDWEDSIRDVLQRLGQATGASRTYVFENHPGEEGAVLTSQRYEWVAPGIGPQIGNQDLQDAPWRTGGFARWEETLARGEPICGHVREFPESEQELLALQGVKSLVAVPIFVGEAWWGLLGFAECVAQREWSAAEVDALKTAAGILGATIHQGRASRALRESEEEYRDLVENINEVIYAVNNNGMVTYVSPVVEQLGGYSQSEVIGRSVAEFIHPDDLALLMESFQKTVSGDLQPFEYRILTKSGEVHWVRTSSRPIVKGGSVVGLRAVLMDITDRKRAEEALRESEERLQQAHDGTVMMLAAAAEAHDLATGQHLQGVRAVTAALAREVGYSDEDAHQLGLAAVLHDIGKIRVPDSVLSNPGTLDAQEWELMKQHSIWGSEFLTGRSGFDLATAIARSHHERWDGTGYPDGLSGKDIPEAATIVAVADSLDAMTNTRPYRAGRSVAGALREVVACSGTQFSPRVVEALLRLHKEKRLPISSRRKLTRART